MKHPIVERVVHILKIWHQTWFTRCNFHLVLLENLKYFQFKYLQIFRNIKKDYLVKLVHIRYIFSLSLFNYIIVCQFHTNAMKKGNLTIFIWSSSQPSKFYPNLKWCYWLILKFASQLMLKEFVTKYIKIYTPPWEPYSSKPDESL